MKSEERMIKAMFYTGIADILLGLIMMLTGWHVWYYNNFHFFGVVGISSLFYSYFHYSLLKRDKNE